MVEPNAQDNNPIVGPDGELIEPDKSVDPLKYQHDYVENVREQITHEYLNGMDDPIEAEASQRTGETIWFGCLIAGGIGILLLVLAVIYSTFEMFFAA